MRQATSQRLAILAPHWKTQALSGTLTAGRVALKTDTNHYTGRVCGLTVSQAKRLRMEDLWWRQTLTPAGQWEPGHGEVKKVGFTTHAGSASVD